jgi:hypothetical protein
MKKLILLILLCVSELSYSQTLQEQVQAKEQKQKAQAAENARYAEDIKELDNLRHQRIRENAHIIVCSWGGRPQIFAFNKGAFYEGFYASPQDFEKTLDAKFLTSFRENGSYSKKGSTVSWKRPYPPGYLLFEVNIETGERFYQNSTDKKIYGPDKCTVSVNNPQNI